ncbi:aminotransferase class III-fold pyridoxal phosphate-dependent enzyme [Jiella endophytica]|uniref:Aminotransferase class III-fold pyridoxal phosphate-dependent enzyme n=1 Tax=Jiella endophytica TaxID=2558362 RepID=A0A4Y8R8A6_9HYPH|nr:aminotransferase class III-fold pyridoxal phosphate-dependent enzyme [Jiella endophytica]TFF17844.1 aminotransferase class III-fold pyridoxal phosphate-dependent enzyme [Jiella endophytica]
MNPTKPILALNAFDAKEAEGLVGRTAEMVERRRATAGASSVLFYREPIEMVRASGVFMYDRAGERYLDVYNNVPSVGHCHPRVVEAIARQAGEMAIHTRYLNDTVQGYSEALLATLPASIGNLVMTCTGSESNDLALRLAMATTGARGFIVTETAYHGNTSLVTEVSPSSLKGGAVPPHVRVVPMPAERDGDGPGDLAARFAGAVAKAIGELQASGHGLAGLIVDTIFSSDGVFADPPGFLKPAVEAVQAAGGIFIADEVQPGFGRTGAGLWGFARHGVTPDIVTMGKPMGNGYPMGGVATRADLLERFCESVGYFNTFGGNTVAAAAGRAVLEVIAGEGLIENAEAVGGYLRAGLRQLAGRRPEIGAVRGAGLFVGLDIVDPDTRAPDARRAGAVINGLRRRHVLVGAAGPFGHTLKIRPPLCFSREHAEMFVAALADVLERPAG